VTVSLFYRQCGEGSKIGEVSSQTVALTQAESEAINELLAAYHKSLEIQMDKDLPRDRANLADLVNIAELSVRRVIAMAKQVSSSGFTFSDIFPDYYHIGLSWCCLLGDRKCICSVQVLPQQFPKS